MILTNALAIEIYKLKISMANNLVLPCSRLIRGRCICVGAHYGVSSRAIRDIWNRKAWSYATQHLWPLESNLSLNPHGQVCESGRISFLILSKGYILQIQRSFRQPGRPKGSRDSKPRINRCSLSNTAKTNKNPSSNFEKPRAQDIAESLNAERSQAVDEIIKLIMNKFE